jgi:molecular chaperone Hsp33
MKDYLVRIITRDVNIRGLACVTTRLVNDACSRQGAYPTASAALGRALTGGALMGALLKTGQRVAIKLQGDGPLKKIVVEADSQGFVKGYVQDPYVDLPLREGKLDVSGALGRKGVLTVTKDLRLKDPYTGIVQLYSGEIAEDLAYYFSESEQIPTAVGLGVFVRNGGAVAASGGFLIQSFPPYDGGLVDEISRKIELLPPITRLLRDGRSPEEMIELIFDGISYDLLETRELAFRCTCSRLMIERALITLGIDEIKEIIREQGEADITCEFCGGKYYFSKEDLEKLIILM